MKFISSFSLLAFIIFAGNTLGSTRGGNGGEGEKAMDFAIYGYLFIDLLKQLDSTERGGLDPEKMIQTLDAAWIKPVKSCDAVGPDGKIIESPSACNFSEAIPQRIEVTDSWKKLTPQQKIGIAGHEIAGLLQFEINTYSMTAPLMKKLTRLYEDKSNLAAQQPILVDQLFDDRERNGFSATQARQHCDNVRRIALKNYFYVFCHFIRKNWQQEVIDFVPVTDYRFMGYEYIRQHSSSEVAMRGIYIGSSTHQNINRPVVRRIERIVPISRLEDHAIFGVKVYGLGAYDPNLPFSQWPQTLLASHELISLPDAIEPQVRHVLESLTYSNSQEAYRACILALRTAMRTEQEKYYRSQCGIGKTDDERWYYVIKTQNPFMHKDF